MRNSLFAAEGPAHVDAMKTLLDDTMRFDKTDMRIHRLILCHQHIGVEPQRGQLEFFRLGDRVFDQAPAQTIPLSLRIDGDIIDEIRVGFRPGNRCSRGRFPPPL